MATVDWHQHALARITFPAAIGGFVRGEVHQYDDWGHNLSAAYSWPAGGPDTNLTFYVYPAGKTTDADQIQQALLDIYDAHSSAQTLGHDRVVVNGLEGLRVDLLLPGAEAGAGLVPSSVVVFKAEGWILKVRATAATALPQFDCGAAAENLARHIGAPGTRRRLDAGLRAAASRAEASMAELRRACDAGGGESADPGRLMRAALESLEGGELVAATEQCMAMEEAGHAGAPLVERALRAYVPAAVTFAGGLGTSPLAPVVVGNARTDDEQVAACRCYLECVLGSPEDGWVVECCDVLLACDWLVDAMHLTGPGAERLLIFFKVGDVPPESAAPGIAGLGRVDMPRPDEGPSISVADQVPKGLAEFLVAHMTTHQAQYLARR